MIGSLRCSATVIILMSSFTIHADSYLPGGPYTLPLDDAIFVMLPGKCNPYTMVHDDLTKQEYQRLRAELDASLETRRNALSSMRTLNPCAYHNAYFAHDGSSGNDQSGWQLRVNTFEWKPKATLRNASGELYPSSGLYPDNDSLTPIWSVDWYARTVLLSRDGRYMIRRGAWASTPDNLAVAFYDRGKLLQAYSVSDLVRNPGDLPHSVSHFKWQKEGYLDDEKGILHLTTLGYEIYEFDIMTGQQVRSELIELPTFTVEIESVSGHLYTLSNFVWTQGDFQSGIAWGLGKVGHQYVIGWETIEPDLGDGKSSIREMGFYFSTIEEITRTDNSSDDEVFWKVKQQSGDEYIIQVTDTGNPSYRFTGKTSDGESVDLLAQDIKKIIFR